MLKKIGFLTFMVFLGFSLTFLVQENDQTNNQVVTNVEDEVDTQPTSNKNVLVKKNKQTKTITKREPAAKKPTQKSKIKVQRIAGRRLLLPIKDLKNISYLNTPNKDWDKKLLKRLGRFGNEDKEFKIEHLDSVIHPQGQSKAVFYEWVRVRYTDGNIPKSYEALVNSESGTVFKVWNTTQISNQKPMKLSPSGSYQNI
ncbi:MAG: hypothetical protein ACPGJV_11325 [Bacteriovoracaceae bacterium]